MAFVNLKLQFWRSKLIHNSVIKKPQTINFLARIIFIHWLTSFPQLGGWPSDVCPLQQRFRFPDRSGSCMTRVKITSYSFLWWFHFSCRRCSVIWLVAVRLCRTVSCRDWRNKCRSSVITSSGKPRNRYNVSEWGGIPMRKKTNVFTRGTYPLWRHVLCIKLWRHNGYRSLS